MIMAFVIAGWSFLYFVGMFCARDTTIEEKKVAHLTFILTPGSIMAIAFAITASISFKRILDETSPLTAWESANGCVADDPYMQIGEHGVQATADRHTWAIVSLSGSWLILCMYFGGAALLLKKN